MATVALISVAVLALLVAVLFGALLEMYRDVRQLREVVGILDRPLTVDIGPVAGTKPSSYGLPWVLDSAASAVVLFLSERCGTCRSLAAGLGRPLPAGLWVVLEARSPDSADAFLDAHGLTNLASASDGRLLVDVAGDIAGRIGLDTTPVGFRVEAGVLIGATTVPSSRYLNSILPEPVRLRRAG
ncbi:MAG TPA: hypothetical protein VGH73_13755 [Thermoanaerobaculia bacterium]